MTMLYGLDDLNRNGGDMLSRSMNRSRARTGVRVLPRTTDVDGFLSACGFRGKRK
ncbi:hypothetical protein [Maricaulis sp. CAU 1757]